MDIPSSYVKEVKLFSKLTSIIFTAWAVTFLLSLGIGTFYFGHLPVYGVDIDPTSLNFLILDIVRWINFISLLFSFIACFAWPILNIHLIINKARLTRTEKILQVSALLSILLFFLFKYLWINQFLWHND